MIDPLEKKIGELELDIPFTQYLRPDGRTRQVIFSVNGPAAGLAKSIMDRGHRFEAEVLTTGEVSLTVTDPENEDGADLCIEISPNGPEVPTAVLKLIGRSSRILTDRSKQ